MALGHDPQLGHQGATRRNLSKGTWMRVCEVPASTPSLQTWLTPSGSWSDLLQAGSTHSSELPEQVQEIPSQPSPSTNSGPVQVLQSWAGMRRRPVAVEGSTGSEEAAWPADQQALGTDALLSHGAAWGVLECLGLQGQSCCPAPLGQELGRHLLPGPPGQRSVTCGRSTSPEAACFPS